MKVDPQAFKATLQTLSMINVPIAQYRVPEGLHHSLLIKS